MIPTKSLSFLSSWIRECGCPMPIMLGALLENGGVCSDREIAQQLLIRDESQIDYYRNITNNMVGRVLRNHGWVQRDSKNKSYSLVGFEELSEAEIVELKQLCQVKIDEFLERRERSIFEHRRKSKG